MLFKSFLIVSRYKIQPIKAITKPIATTILDIIYLF
jgi:hypothetical protein